MKRKVCFVCVNNVESRLNLFMYMYLVVPYCFVIGKFKIIVSCFSLIYVILRMTGTNGRPVFVYIVKFSGTENFSTKRKTVWT